MSAIVNIVGGYVHPLALTPALWMDASDASSLSLTGSAVNQWNDKSGNARHYAQSTVSKKPTYVSAAYNGLNTVRFDGANDTLALGSSDLFRNVSGATVYALLKWSSSPTTERHVFSVARNAAGSSRLAVGGGRSSGKAFAGGRRLDADSFAECTSSASLATSLILHTALFDYGNSDVYQYLGSGLDGSNTSYQTNGSTSNTASVASYIGSTVSDTLYFAGDLCELLVYHTAHDTLTRQRVWSYLRHKWGI